MHILCLVGRHKNKFTGAITRNFIEHPRYDGLYDLTFRCERCGKESQIEAFRVKTEYIENGYLYEAGSAFQIAKFNDLENKWIYQ